MRREDTWKDNDIREESPAVIFLSHRQTPENFQTEISRQFPDFQRHLTWGLEGEVPETLGEADTVICNLTYSPSGNFQENVQSSAHV